MISSVNFSFESAGKNLLLLIAMLFVFSGCGDGDIGITDPPVSPEIISISPNRGPAGTVVTIRGSGFSSTASENTVTFNETEAVVNSAASSVIEAVVPDTANTGAVEVTVDAETAIGPVFTIEQQMPGIASIEPDSGVVGKKVTIKGMNFSSTATENTITFNSTEAPVNMASDTLLTTEVPAGATSGQVEVIVEDDTASGPTFTVITWGDLLVRVSTSGSDPDPDGYNILFNDEDLSVATNDTVLFNNHKAGTYELELDGIAGNCSVTGNNPSMVDITAGDTTSASFEVICSETTGTLEAIVTTSGVDQDTDGYTLTLDGSDSRASAINDTTFLENLSEETHDIQLTGNADNCSVSGDNPRMVEIVAGDTTTTTFSVFCQDLIKNQIVFSSDRNGNNEIYVMDTDGGNQNRLANDPGSDTDPAVSPDGSMVAFSSDRDGNREIHIMNADGTNVTQLTFTASGDSFGPVWSPDGSQLAFTRFTGAQNYEIFTINADGTNETNITTNSANDVNPDWSPDGNRLAFTTDRDGNNEIYLMDPDGSNLLRLTNTAGSITDTTPAWSPDGTQIAFSTNRLQSTDIYLMNADGTGASQLTTSLGEETFPSWSPNGTRIVFETDRDGNAEIYRIDVDGSGVVSLSGNANLDENPDWSPVE